MQREIEATVRLVYTWINLRRPDLWVRIQDTNLEQDRILLNQVTGCNVQAEDPIIFGMLSHLHRLEEIFENRVD